MTLSMNSILRGYAAEIRVIPMGMTILTTIFGATLAVGPAIDWGVLLLVLVNAFCFLYVAHLNDTLWDIRKGEYGEGRELHSERPDEDAFLPRLGFGLEIPNAPLLAQHYYLIGIILVASLGTYLSYAISQVVGLFYFPLSLGGLTLALTYSAGLDKVPALGDTMWELGVLFALFCGYFAMQHSLDLPVFQTAFGLFIALAGVKILDGWYDIPTDSKRGKKTLPVYLDSKGVSWEHIRDLGFGLVYVTLTMLYIQLPSFFYPAITIGLITILWGHFRYRGRDMNSRLGLTFAGSGIMLFLLVSLLTIFFG